MVDESQNKTDDFFSLMEKDQKIEDPFADDEILFRDEKGNLRALKGGEVSGEPARKGAVASSPAVAVKTAFPTGKPLSLDQEVENIIKKSGLSLMEEKTRSRFASIITSYLKGIRDRVATREMLLSPPLAGGMEFDSETADRIFAAVNQEAEQLDGRLRQEASNEPFSDLKAEAQQILAEPIAEPPTMVFKSKPATEESVPVEASKPVDKPQLPLSTKVVSPSAQPTTPAPVKPKVEDVKFQPRLIGPIEEIRTMTPDDFRRLAPNPTEAIRKIIEKINILEEESFTKKTQAVQAWKESGVNRLYLQLGDQSMEEKKPLSAIIAERIKANQLTLTEKELEAVIELNQKLRY